MSNKMKVDLSGKTAIVTGAGGLDLVFNGLQRTSGAAGQDDLCAVSG